MGSMCWLVVTLLFVVFCYLYFMFQDDYGEELQLQTNKYRRFGNGGRLTYNPKVSDSKIKVSLFTIRKEKVSAALLSYRSD